MDGTNQAEARVILQNWLVANKVKQSQLAREAEIHRSIISRFLKGRNLDADSARKLYKVLEKSMSPVDRRTFLKALGLLPFIALTPSDSSPKLISQIDEKPPDSYEAGMRLFVSAMDTAQHSWEEAIPLFLQAEQAFGPASSQAARAACEAIQQFINLGEYERAEQEVRRVQNSYEQVMDPDTKSRLNGVIGWLEYYEGNLAESKKRFESCLELAQLTGVERLGDGANHFLGKIYSAYGQMSPQKQEADLLFHTAEKHFQVSFLSSLKRGNEGSQAFEIFRQSQLLQVWGDYQRARQFRNRAYQMFGRQSGVFHIGIAEANLALEEGEIRTPKLKAEDALSGWAHEKYARGMSNAITVLAIADRQQGKPIQAFELLVAALCIYPPQSPWKTNQLLSQIEDMRDWLVIQQGRRQHHLLVQNLFEKVRERKGYFSYLDCIVGERNNTIVQVFRLLGLE